MHILIILLNFLLTSINATYTNNWQILAPGLEFQILDAGMNNSEGDSKINILRIDPHLWELVFAGLSQSGKGSTKTVKEWCESHKLVAAINAGMFATDYRTHTGYLKYRDHVNSRYINSYQSSLAFDPVEGKDFPPFRIFDLDESGVTLQTIQNDYRINVWKQQDRKWSEAAIGEDKEGKILFIFTRFPFSMYDLNTVLLKSGIDIIAAQHLEGGPEAQLYIKIGDFELELCGSYETSYNENNSSTVFWPIPNIIGVKSK
jgi:hypothetical protein